MGAHGFFGLFIDVGTLAYRQTAELRLDVKVSKTGHGPGYRSELRILSVYLGEQP